MEDSKKMIADAMEKSIASPKEKPRDIKTAIAELKPLIAQALPKHLTADRIIQMATNYIRTNPALSKCSEHSLLGAIMQCSLTGLEPIPAFGHCYFVPRKANKGTKDKPLWIDEVSFEIGYKGYIKLAHNTGQVKSIYAEVVYDNDEFYQEKGLFKQLKHIPSTGSKGDLKGVYAVIHYLNGAYDFKYLEKAEIEKFRVRNPTQKMGLKGSWATDYETMAQAKSLKVLLKMQPLTGEAQAALATDGAVINEKAFSNNQTGLDIQAVELNPDEWMTEFDQSENNALSA
jgi:recombination protein RecT